MSKPPVIKLDFRDCLDLQCVQGAAQLLDVHPGEAANYMILILEELFKIEGIESSVTEEHVRDAVINVRGNQLRMLDFIQKELLGQNKDEILNWMADKVYTAFGVIRKRRAVKQVKQGVLK